MADHLLAKRHKATLKKGRHFARLSPAARHEVRIACKKLRYAADFFRSLYKQKKASAYIRSLAALQDDLGHLNDVATAESLLARLRDNTPATGKRAVAVAHGAGLVLGWHARAAIDAEPRMVDDWRAFAAEKPFWHVKKG
jgi:CHAD domain-containing protein